MSKIHDDIYHDPTSKDLDALQERIGYKFKNVDLLKTALTHTSYLSVNQRENMKRKDNERLEFLGDAVLELCVSNYLFLKHHDMSEGVMTRARASAVCEEALFEVAQNYRLGECLYLSPGEYKSGGAEKPSILSDAVEALLAAMFLDGGYEVACTFVLGFASKTIDQASVNPLIDSKTRLQEWLQRDGAVSIRYLIEAEEGPAHDKMFATAVEVNGKILGRGKGHNKKEAEQAAAAEALELIAKEESNTLEN